ncbi:MAG: hypothetical protein GY777_24615 [Candidatus Brocadiaceae bacterium]|nr:hypothetical protein [Candidatus Brocadiaceae bacterium]
MKLYRSLIILVIISFSCMNIGNADFMDDFISNINPDMSKEQAIRFAMENAFEIKTNDSLKRKLKLFFDSVNDIKILAQSMHLKKEKLDKIIHALGFSLAKDIMSDGIYSIDEIREYCSQIDPDKQILKDVINGMKLEIKLRKNRHRNNLIKELIEVGFSQEVAEKAAFIEEKEEQSLKVEE